MLLLLLLLIQKANQSEGAIPAVGVQVIAVPYSLLQPHSPRCKPGSVPQATGNWIAWVLAGVYLLR